MIQEYAAVSVKNPYLTASVIVGVSQRTHVSEAANSKSRTVMPSTFRHVLRYSSAWEDLALSSWYVAGLEIEALRPFLALLDGDPNCHTESDSKAHFT
jgi:hypothetical protein